MPGGNLELSAIGSQDIFLTGNPILTFFKVVYKRYTNFSMEYISKEFTKLPTFSTTSKTTVDVKIDRNGDLLSDIYLVYDLPNIYSTSDENFKWIDNLGSNIIYMVSIIIGGALIDHHYGIWLNIWNEITLSNTKKEYYTEMINSNTSFGYNGEYSTTQTPTFPAKRLYIPFEFWFCKNPGLALPLIALQRSEVIIKIEYEPLNNLFTIGSNDQSPLSFYNITDTDSLSSGEINLLNNYNKENIFWKFINGTTSSGLWNQRTYLEVNYIFLDEDERKHFALSNHEYLITQTNRRYYDGLDKSNYTLNLNLHHPTKELIWIAQRDDINQYNQWNNYSSSLTTSNVLDGNINNKTHSLAFDNGKNILYSARLIFDGNDRFAEKDINFFNLQQCYKYHSGSTVNKHIYLYSFSLNPEKIQPSGSCNMSAINKIELRLFSKEPFDSSLYKYNIQLFSTNYNIIRIMSGSSAIVFTS